CVVTPLSFQGTAVNTTIRNSNLVELDVGAHTFGASGSLAISNSAISTIVAAGGATESNINLRGSWSGGTFMVPHNFKITSAADNGSGLIRLLVDSTTGYSTGFVTDVVKSSGDASCNGTWTVTVVDPTHFDLQGSTFVATCAGNGGSLPLN